MRRKQNSFTKFMITVLFIGAIAGAGFIYLSPQFEQNKPKITFSTNEFWNLKDKLQISISDESSVKYYKVTFIDGNNEVVLAEKVFTNNTNTTQDIFVKPPKLDIFYKGNDVKIKVTVIDNSKWNFLNGNEITKIYSIKVDKQKPIADIIANSRYIKRGGSAIVIVNVEDDNLKDAYISFNKEINFKLVPFYKDGYFISLIAWDINIEKFKRVNLIAIDKAGNKTVSKIPLYIQNAYIKKSKLKISNRFIQNVSEKVLNKSNIDIPNNDIDTFLAQNDILRKSNVDFLRKMSLEKMDFSKISSFNIKPLKRLKGSKRVSGYGERRHYIYNNKQIDEQWHLGVDFAKYKHSKVYPAADGKVFFNNYLGIYGNTIVLDHGLGLATLYAHLSTTKVQLDQTVYKSTKIGITGITGAVLGDHLHFGVLVQGIEVDPVEWMSRKWLKERITNVVKEAKKIIKQK